MAQFLHVRKQKHYRERVECDVDTYKELYRFTENNVEWLADHFLGEYTETRGKALSSKQRMMVFLRFLADPGYQNGIAEDLGISRSTVTKTVPFVLEKIVDKSKEWVIFPTGRGIDEAKVEWTRRFNFPTAFAAIDCTHIPISKPTLFGDDYVNRKGVTTINVQATCNAQEKFTSIDAQWPGSVHDSRILRNSAIYDVMNRAQVNAVILGDIGYGISPWLMTPYENPMTQEEKAYNKIHAKERVIIERCFGQLKKRFSILQNPIRVALDKVPSIVLACATLHNIAKHLQDEFPWNDSELEQDNADGAFEGVPENEAARRRHGQRKRDELKNVISNM